jgi:hypothetical protein
MHKGSLTQTGKDGADLMGQGWMGVMENLWIFCNIPNPISPF